MKISIETGRWYNTNKEHTICTKCSEDFIGDEFHFLFVCSNPEIVNLHKTNNDLKNITQKTQDRAKQTSIKQRVNSGE